MADQQLMPDGASPTIPAPCARRPAGRKRRGPFCLPATDHRQIDLRTRQFRELVESELNRQPGELVAYSAITVLAACEAFRVWSRATNRIKHHAGKMAPDEHRATERHGMEALERCRRALRDLGLDSRESELDRFIREQREAALLGSVADDDPEIVDNSANGDDGEKKIDP